MRKIITIILCVLLMNGLTVKAWAAPDGPVITMQPQSYYYPEYSVAIYTVKATGTNLSAYWYIEWEGKTYNASQIGGAMQPWEGYAGESYGAKKLDDNTFCFVFEGIEEELSGAEIWCEIEDGHYSVPSQVGHIVAGTYSLPPEILDIPASITVQQGEEAEIRCIAKSTDGSQLEFIWYETGTGKFEDLQAINRGAETSDYMFCDTSTIGTRYYVCGITTSGGGMAYSSAVEVNVVEKTTPVAEPEIQAKTLPAAVVGEPPAAETTVPTESVPQTTQVASETTAPTQTENEDTKVLPPKTQMPIEESAGVEQAEERVTGIPWWALALFALVGAAAGVGTAVLLIRKNRK